MKPLYKALIAIALTLFFLYKVVSDTAMGQGLVPLDSPEGSGALITNLSYMFPLLLSILWLLKSVREIALNKDD